MGELIQISATYGLRFNYLSFAAALISPKYVTPEQALHMVYGELTQTKPATTRSRKYTQEMIDDIEAMRADGMTWGQVGEVFGISKETAFAAWKRNRKPREEDVCELII